MGEVLHGDKKLFTIFFTGLTSTRKQIEEKITSYNLYHDKSISDANIVSALEELLTNYENISKRKDIEHSSIKIPLSYVIDSLHKVINTSELTSTESFFFFFILQ